MSLAAAREQARDKADNAFYAGDTDPSFTAADAASDVWEPIVLKLLDMLVAAGLRPELLDEIMGDTLTE